MSAARYFHPITVPAEAGRRRVHRIACSECPTNHEISANTYCGSLATEDLLRRWARAGWVVGAKPNADLCPSCAAAKRKARRIKAGAHVPPEPAPVAILDLSEPAPMSPTNVHHLPVIVEPPVEMGRDDRRIIFAKLDEVYLSADKGYSAGWTDHRIATDLGVPRAWVERVREEMFGPARDNEDIRELREHFAALRGDMNICASRIEALLNEAKVAKEEFVALRQRADRFEKRIGEIEKQVS